MRKQSKARKTAERVIEELQVSRTPVNVELVARGLGLRIHRDVLEKGVSGALIKTKGASQIVVNVLDAKVRQRFSIAHEIGHHVLAHEFKGERVHVDRGHVLRRDEESSLGVHRQEIEANQFASSLLMPLSLLEPLIEERIAIGPLDDGDVTELALRFQVSEQAMTLRLTGLNLL